MCGIAGVHIIDPTHEVARSVDRFCGALLDGIDNRGGDATGLAVYTAGRSFDLQKASCRAWRFNKLRRPLPADARTVLLHTRMATQGAPEFPENNHPIRRGGTVIVHNGVLWNDPELFTRAEATRRGHVDSEAIAVMLDRFGLHNVQEALGPLDGSFAIAALDIPTGAMLLARGNSSPLAVLIEPGAIVWASEAGAIRGALQAIEAEPRKWDATQLAAQGTFLHIAADGAQTIGAFKPTPMPVWTPPKVKNDWTKTPKKATPKAKTKAEKKAEKKAGRAATAALPAAESSPYIATPSSWRLDPTCQACFGFFEPDELITIADTRVCEECARYFDDLD